MLTVVRWVWWRQCGWWFGCGCDDDDAMVMMMMWKECAMMTMMVTAGGKVVASGEVFMGIGRSSIRGLRFYPEFVVSIRKLVVRPEVFDLPHPELISFGDMHTYVSQLKNTELEALVATYDIPLDLRPRLPDPNFRMINLPVGDTTIGIYSRIFDSSGVRIPFSSFLLAVLKYFKVHISQLVPLDKVPTSFNQDHVDRLKAHIVKLRDIPEGVLVRSGLSRVWRNPMCDLVLRRSDNTVMSIHDFLCIPSLDKATVREEPHELGTSILGRVADRTTSPAPVGIAIPHASSKEITITRPDPKVVTKADHAAKQKTSTGPEISTNTAKRTSIRFRMCLESRNGSDLGLDVTYPPILLPNKEVEAHTELSGGVRRTTRASSHASHAPDTQPLDTDAGADEISSDGNVDPYYEAQVSNTARDMLERDLLPIVPGPYCIPYPYVEDLGYESTPYTKNDWDEIHGVNLAKAHRLRELSSVELSDRMSVLQCQLVTHVSVLNARYDHSLKNVERLTKRCAQQTQIIKKQGVDLKQQKESTVRANEEVSRLTTELGVLKSRCQTVENKLTSKVRRSRVTLPPSFSQTLLYLFEGSLRVVSLTGCLRKVAGFISDAKEKFDRVIAAFPDTTFPFLDMVSQHSQSSLQDIARLEPDRVTSSHQPSSATASLRANTHVRHSTSSSGTFGHTSTPEHLKKKKKSVEKGATHRRVFIMREREGISPPSAAESISRRFAQPNRSMASVSTIGDKLVGVTLFAWR
ncbi:hypothetical protein Tco_0088006 [Tanacetum coccineum]